MPDREGCSFNPELDKPGEACGVIGIFAPGQPLKEMIYAGLQTLQHRGQEAAGVGINNNPGILLTHGLGLVKDALDGGSHLAGLPNDGYIATGHTRYSTRQTQALKSIEAIQPTLYTSDSRGVIFTLAHNGHVDDLDEVARTYNINPEEYSTDSQLMRDIIGREHETTSDLTEALKHTLARFMGAYSLVLSTETELIAARDPQGFRPLHLGKLGEGGWVVASEIAALNITGAAPVSEVEPGEILTISGPGEDEITSTRFAEADPAVCSFEFVYFSRPDNSLLGETVLEVRERMGKILADRETISADMVIGVPESGRIAAMGYAAQSGIRHSEALVKNTYVDRSFIASSQGERISKVRSKLNPIPAAMEGKRLIVIDDSIVRGNTTRELVRMLREAGAAEIHLRISSPPYRWPCYFGMDTGNRDELLAASLSIKEMQEYVGADSLDFLTDTEFNEALGKAAGKVCTACTTGIYPININRSGALPILATA